MEQMKRKRKRDIAIKCCKTTAKFTFNLLALSLLLSPSPALAVDFKINPLDQRLAKIAGEKIIKKTLLYQLKNNPIGVAGTASICATGLKNYTAKKCPKTLESAVLIWFCGVMMGKIEGPW